MSQEEPFKIIVVGGATGGMSAAVRLRRLNENAAITLIEKRHNTSYADSGAPSSLGGVIKSDTFLIHQSPIGLKERFNLDVRDCTELVSISKEEHSILVRQSETNDSYCLSFDKLVLAQGSHLTLPHVHGIDRPNVFTFQTMLDLEQIKDYVYENRCQSAAILGGGYLALKALECLYNFGLRISIIHDQAHIFSELDTDLANLLQSNLTQNGIQLRLNANILNIASGAFENDCFVTIEGDANVRADLVVVATSLSPLVKIAKNSGIQCKDGVVVNEFMQTSDPDIYAIGDMTQTQNFTSPPSRMLPLGSRASQQGRLAADHIMKRGVPSSGHVGTYSCKVFRLTAAVIGFSVERLEEVGYHPKSVTVHVPDHEAYYPSSQQMTLRLAFQPSGGRLLGAQIIGRSGVDQRADVLSTALQAGMSVFDLERLQLLYAPQYGTGKDPVNVAGMVASNLLRGDLHMVSPRELDGHLQDWQIIDVRSPDLFAKGHVPSAQNIPIDELRGRLADIHKQCPVLVYSRVGYHGYLAYRTLVQLGYRAANLNGGLKLLVEGGFGIGLVSSGSE